MRVADEKCLEALLPDFHARSWASWTSEASCGGCTATLVVSAERWRVLRDTAAARPLSMTTAQRTAHELQMRGSVAADLGGQPQRVHPEL